MMNLRKCVREIGSQPAPTQACCDASRLLSQRPGVGSQEVSFLPLSRRGRRLPPVAHVLPLRWRPASLPDVLDQPPRMAAATCRTRSVAEVASGVPAGRARPAARDPPAPGSGEARRRLPPWTHVPLSIPRRQGRRLPPAVHVPPPLALLRRLRLRDPVNAAHVRHERGRQRDGAIRLLAVFENGHHEPR